MNHILQADVPSGGTVAMTTGDILNPGRITRIILPAAPEGEGWFELKFSVCKRKFMDPVTTADVKDITEVLTGVEFVYLPEDKMEVEVELEVKKYYWWFVIFVTNRMLEDHFITCQVRIEDAKA